jgi:hypothetical protein
MQEHTGKRPYAIILAGYDKPDRRTMIKRKREIVESYEGDEIFIGKNKFLQDIAGKPVIQYILDAVYDARKNGEPLYEKIFVYNDVRNFTDAIDTSRYENLEVQQMKSSVGGHLRDFYFNHVDYGRRVDVFFGDTPRITTEDVEYINAEYDDVLGKKTDFRGNTAYIVYAIVEYEDMKDDNWLTQRIKVIKRGKNKGKLKTFVGFDGFQARVGNSSAIIKHTTLDQIVEKESINFFYNLRKALAPSNFSKILYHIWKTRHTNVVQQVKNKCLDEELFYITCVEIIERVDKIDLSDFGGYIYHIKKNAARWENDIDGPKDLEIFRQHMEE